jgi:hypothetical protein
MNRRTIAAALLLATLFLMSLSGAAAQDDPIRIIFMHHSTGAGLIWQGGAREGLTERGYEFWDHGYNDEGLTDATGEKLGLNWDVPGDNTDPDGWYAIFNQPVGDPPDNTFSHMLEYDVIIFKSCFPSSDIQSEEQFETYRDYYLSIRDVIDEHPDKLFIPFTTPPLVPNATTPENAARARRWSEYLTSDEYLDGHPNIVVFDIFGLLADEDGFLREDYRVDEWDSHPNDIANGELGAALVERVDLSIQQFFGIEAPARQSSAAPQAADMIQDFETMTPDESWYIYLEDDTEITCDQGEPGYESDGALQITFQAASGRYPACSRGLTNTGHWAEAQGLSFFWKSDAPGMSVGILLWIEQSPFELKNGLETPGATWTLVNLDWDDFQKASWADDSNLDVLEPSRIDAIAITFGSWEQPQQGTIWIDDLRLTE